MQDHEKIQKINISWDSLNNIYPIMELVIPEMGIIKKLKEKQEGIARQSEKDKKNELVFQSFVFQSSNKNFVKMIKDDFENYLESIRPKLHAAEKNLLRNDFNKSVYFDALSKTEKEIPKTAQDIDMFQLEVNQKLIDFYSDLVKEKQALLENQYMLWLDFFQKNNKTAPSKIDDSHYLAFKALILCLTNHQENNTIEPMLSYLRNILPTYNKKSEPKVGSPIEKDYDYYLSLSENNIPDKSDHDIIMSFEKYPAHDKIKNDIEKYHYEYGFIKKYLREINLKDLSKINLKTYDQYHQFLNSLQYIVNVFQKKEYKENPNEWNEMAHLFSTYLYDAYIYKKFGENSLKYTEKKLKFLLNHDVDLIKNNPTLQNYYYNNETQIHDKEQFERNISMLKDGRLQLKNSSDIPPVCFTSDNNEHYWITVPFNHPEFIAFNSTIGNAFGNCQHIGGAGEAFCRNIINLSSYGIMVYVKNKKHPQALTSEDIMQLDLDKAALAYVDVTLAEDNTALIMDSLEIKSTTPDKDKNNLQSALKSLASYLIKENIVKDKVVIGYGLGIGTPESLGKDLMRLQNPYLPKEGMIPLDSSTRQRVLAEQPSLTQEKERINKQYDIPTSEIDKIEQLIELEKVLKRNPTIATNLKRFFANFKNDREASSLYFKYIERPITADKLEKFYNSLQWDKLMSLQGLYDMDSVITTKCYISPYYNIGIDQSSCVDSVNQEIQKFIYHLCCLIDKHSIKIDKLTLSSLLKKENVSLSELQKMLLKQISYMPIFLTSTEIDESIKLLNNEQTSLLFEFFKSALLYSQGSKAQIKSRHVSFDSLIRYIVNTEDDHEIILKKLNFALCESDDVYYEIERYKYLSYFFENQLSKFSDFLQFNQEVQLYIYNYFKNDIYPLLSKNSMHNMFIHDCFRFSFDDLKITKNATIKDVQIAMINRLAKISNIDISSILEQLQSLSSEQLQFFINKDSIKSFYENKQEFFNKMGLAVPSINKEEKPNIDSKRVL